VDAAKSRSRRIAQYERAEWISLAATAALVSRAARRPGLWQSAAEKTT